MASPATGVRDAIQALSWTHHPGVRGLTILAGTWPKCQTDKDSHKCQEEWDQHSHNSKLEIFSSDFKGQSQQSWSNPQNIKAMDLSLFLG